MAYFNLKNISEWSPVKKIISGVILLLIIWIIWSFFGGLNNATQSILNLPEATIQAINEEGEEIKLQIRVNEVGVDFSNVDSSVIEEIVLYRPTDYSASVPIEIDDVSVSIALALFADDGQLINIYRVGANEQKTINPEKRYKYTLMSRDGYFTGKGISVENGTKLLIESLQLIGE